LRETHTEILSSWSQNIQHYSKDESV